MSIKRANDLEEIRAKDQKQKRKKKEARSSLEGEGP